MGPLPQFPIIEVSHLPSSASFYADISQPLGIFYLSSSPARLHFGYLSDLGPQVIFALQQSPICPPRPSHITLLAQSPKSVKDFYERCLTSNSLQRDHGLLKNGEATTARARDLDGNMLEAVYAPRRPAIETASTVKEARRVLEWQQDVARSVAASRTPEHSPARSTSTSETRPLDSYRQTESYTVTQPPMRLVRRDTVTTEHYRRPDGGAGGFSGMKLVDPLPPAPVRRASHDQYSPLVERRPSRSTRSYVPEPKYVTQYTITATPPMGSIEEASTRNRSGKSLVTQERSRSNVESRYDHPLTILSGPRSSSREPAPALSPTHVSHRSHRSDRRSERDRDERSVDHSDNMQESFVSVRTHHTAAPMGSKHGQHVQYVAEPSRSHASRSRTDSECTVRLSPSREDKERSAVSARHVPLPPSLVSARHIPLPASVVGSNYAASVAPSDSVSSIGVKRERERLRDRMRERW